MLRSPMNEVQRQYYLNQCGITLWYARKPLPGAAASAAQDFSRITAPSASPPAAKLRPRLTEQLKSASSPEPAQSRPAIPVTRTPAPAIVSTAVPASPEPHSVPPTHLASAPAMTAPAVAQTLLGNLDLRIVFSRSLVILGEIGGEVSSESQDRLLRNIASAVHIPSTELHSLAWPVFGNRRVPGNDDSGLAEVLGRKFAGLQKLPWLGIGPDLDKVFSLLGSSGETDSVGRRLIFGESLGSVAASGQLKRELWQLIIGSGLTGNVE